jgi:hypothetical protein
VDGSIPPNKSDLKAFGIYVEEDEFLNLFWSRVQDPSGTTNMDFELNQRACTPDQTPADPDCTANGLTPIRTGDGTGSGVDDILITYDLSRGGTVATISIRKWTGSVWGPAVVLDQQSEAVGSINTSAIADSALGSLSPRTFGEAQVTFEALFGDGACGSFGSAYLKSRSSDSFTAALKDFVPPREVEIGNCPTELTTDASNNGTASEPAQTLGGSISDSATLGSSVPNGADGKIEFRLYGPYTAQDKPTGPNAVCAANKLITAYGNTTPTPDGVGRTNVVNHNVTGAGNTANPYASPSFTPTAVGFYQWTAKFVPDAGQGLDPSAEFGCGQAVEQSQVIALPTATNTAQSFIPNDSATISQTAGTATALNGSVEFKLYNNSTNCNTNGATGLLYNETVTVSGNPPQTVSTNNDGVPADESSTDTDTDPGYTVRASTTDNLFWRVTYTPAANSSHSGSSSVCVEDSSVTISNT